MKVLVCGGRDYSDYQKIEQVLSEIGPTLIIQGGARGADSGASIWAEQNGVPQLCYLADWYTHGKAAGPIRNKQMLVEGKPDLVVAFPGGRGTANMIKQAKAANIPVKEVDG